MLLGLVYCLLVFVVFVACHCCLLFLLLTVVS